MSRKEGSANSGLADLRYCSNDNGDNKKMDKRVNMGR